MVTRGLVKPAEFQTHPVSFATAQARGQWRGIVKQVHDGDTIVVFVDKGFFDYQMLRLRLAGASAPELNEAGGAAARDYLMQEVLNCPVVFTPEMSRAGSERMSFDRYVATVFTVEGPDALLWDIGADLIAKGHATETPT